MGNTRLLVLLAMLASAVGCGQKGPLVLPDAQHPRKKVKFPAAPKTPAASSTQPSTSTSPSPAPAPSAPAGPAPVPAPPEAAPAPQD